LRNNFRTITVGKSLKDIVQLIYKSLDFNVRLRLNEECIESSSGEEKSFDSEDLLIHENFIVMENILRLKKMKGQVLDSIFPGTLFRINMVVPSL